jgi:hypothetical protein
LYPENSCFFTLHDTKTKFIGHIDNALLNIASATFVLKVRYHGNSVLRIRLKIFSAILRTAILAFSKANSQTNWMQIDCIFYKNGLSFHTNNYFITQILPENIKILTGILPDFCLGFTVGGGGGISPSHTLSPW